MEVAAPKATPSVGTDLDTSGAVRMGLIVEDLYVRRSRNHVAVATPTNSNTVSMSGGLVLLALAGRAGRYHPSTGSGS